MNILYIQSLGDIWSKCVHCFEIHVVMLCGKNVN